jgi:putative membrane protein
MIKPILACAALLLSLPAIALAQGAAPRDTSEQTQVPVPGTGQADSPSGDRQPSGDKASVSAQDREFINKATIGNLTERRQAEMAISQGSSPAVEKFAQRMVVDHRNAQEQLGQVASSLQITPPMATTSDQAMTAKLEGKSGAEFDKLYADMQVQAHQEAVALYKQEAASGQNPEIKAFAAKLLPALEDHLKMAQAMAEEVRSRAGR